MATAQPLDWYPGPGGTYTLHFACPLCRRVSAVHGIDLDRWKAWRDGAFLVQEAFPGLTGGERGTLMSGEHPECFALAFGDDGDEADSDEPVTY